VLPPSPPRAHTNKNRPARHKARLTARIKALKAA